MAFFVYDPSGKPVGLLAAGENPDALRANGYTVNEVSDADVTTDASGRVLVSMAALQQQQAFANSLQAAAALRQVEQNRISAYTAQTGRLGEIIPLVGQTKNYGLLSNITAGDARAPYLSVPAGLSRMAGPSPIQSDYSQAETYSAKDVSDFAKKATTEKTSAEKQSAGAKPAQTGVTQAPKAQSATLPQPQQAAQSLGWGPPNASGQPVSAARSNTGLRLTYPDGSVADYSTGNAVVSDFDMRFSADPAFRSKVDASNEVALGTFGAAGHPGISATYNDALTGKTAEVPGAAMHAQSGQSAWEARRDALLGGQRHDDFQMAHSTTAQELNDIAKMNNPSERLAAFNALKARPAWTPETSHGSNWRPSGDTSGSAYKHGNTFDYNAAPTQTFQQPQERGENRSMALTREQQHKLDQKRARDRAAGGTDVLGGTDMARPPMFGQSPTAGMGFDPHAPTQTPENLQEIASILQAPPSPSPSALEAAVRECWSLDPQSGRPMYTGHYGDNAAKGTDALPDGGLLAPPPSAAPPSPLGGPLPSGGKPAMFAEGGTSGADRRVGPNATYDPRWGFLPTQPTGAVATPSSAPPTVSYSGLPPTPKPPAAGTAAAASGGRSGATPTRSGPPARGGARAEQPTAPSADMMKKVTNYYVAQFGGTEADATKDIQSGSAESAAWLRSALGMALAGQLDQYDTAPASTATSAEPVTAAAAAPVQPVPPPAAAPSDSAGAVMGGVNNGLRLGGRVTTAADSRQGATPHPDEVKAAIQGMAYEDAVAYIASLYGREADAVATAPRAAGGTDFVYYDDPQGGYRPGVPWTPYVPLRPDSGGAAGGIYPVAISEPLDPLFTTVPNRNAAGGTTFVARRPTLFNAGGQQFLVGEDTAHGYPSGADELVSISGQGGQTVVHVDPLQRRGTGIPPAVAATANLAVPGAPYRPKAGLPASAIGPGRADAYAAGGTDVLPVDPSMGGGDPAAGLPDVIPVGNGVVLVRQPDGSYLPVNESDLMASGGDQQPMGGEMMPMGLRPSPMAAGGTRVYGTVAPGATISRVGGQPSATGQVKVPGGKGGSTTQPFYRVQPFPDPAYALSRRVDALTPDELQQVGLVTQNRVGYDVNQWAALQAQGRLKSQAPAAFGVFNRPF